MTFRSALLASALAILPVTAFAAQPKPSAASTKSYSALVKAPPQAKESFQTRQAAIHALVKAHKAGRLASLPPIAGQDGEILYPYGQSWPTVVASPQHVAVIELASGDKPNKVIIGQPGEWRITQSMAGKQPILAVSPRYAGLHTNLMITATSASGKSRVYYLNLVSDKSKYIPRVGFYFPGRMEQRWHAHAQQTANETVADLPNLNASDLDFHWRISCGGGGWFSSSACGSIKPSRVFSDGTHTYIQMQGNAANTTGLPTILADNAAGKPAVINFQVKDGFFIVDSVPSKIKMVAGVGSKARVVDLTRER